MAVIRTSKAQDAWGVARVHVETWRDTYPTLVPQEYLIDHLDISQVAAFWARRLKRESYREQCLVAVNERDEVLGYALWGPARGVDDVEFGAAYAPGKSGEIYEIYVDTDEQNQGIGRALCQAVVRRLREYGMTSLCIEVLDGNPARFFYENLGGRQLAIKDRPFAGAILPTLIYGWETLEVPAFESDEA